MWKLDHTESWVLKNWCFWIVVLEKTLETLLDWKEMQPVHLKGNQSWMFIGTTDAETETPILWPPDVKNWLIWRPWCWERLKVEGEGDDREWDSWMASPTWWMWVPELMKDQKAWHAAVRGVSKSRKRLRDWTDPLTDWGRETLGLVWVFSTSRGICPELILVTHGRQD